MKYKTELELGDTGNKEAVEIIHAGMQWVRLTVEKRKLLNRSKKR